MSEPPVTPPAGDPTDLKGLAEQLGVRNSVLVRLAQGVERLAVDVSKLRHAVRDRPTKAAVAHRRRRAAVAAILFGGLIIWGHDQHVEHCSPGSQALAILEFAVDREPTDPPLTQKQINRVIADTTPSTGCDITFPLHHHGIDHDAAGLNGGEGDTLYHVAGLHLTGWNLVGLLLYAALGVILYAYQRGPRRHDDDGGSP